jgi:hypothetical protein
MLSSYFSLTELNELLNEEDKVLEMIQKMSEVMKMKEDREKLSNSCIELASEYIYNVENRVRLSNSCIELASKYIYNVKYCSVSYFSVCEKI